jgi:tetratricopeptide (TPR) repeat protein
VLGEEHPDTARSYNNLATTLADQGKHAQAEPLYEKALAIRLKVLGERHPDTAHSWHNLAYTLSAQGKYAQAQPLFEKALRIRRKALGETHPHTAASCNGVAYNLADQGKHAQAQLWHEKALAILRQARGEGHPETAQSCKNLAITLQAQAKYAQAQPLFEKALAARRQALGEGHPHTAQSYYNLAGNLWRQGKLAQAVRLWQASRPALEAARFHLSASGFDRSLAGARSPNPYAALAIGLARLGQPANAFRAAEAGLARGLLDDLAALPGGNPQEEAARLRRLDARLLALYGRALTADQRRLRDELTRQRERVLGELSRLAAAASARQVLPLGQIQAHLPADAALVLWLDDDALGEHRACVVRREGPPSWQALPGSGPGGAWTDDDRSLPDRLYRSLTDRGAGQAQQRELIAALRRQRLTPLARHLRAGGTLPAVRHLLVVPVGWAAAVPVEVLASERTVNYVPSGSVFARLKRRHRPLRASSLLALGDPAFGLPRRHRSDPPRPGVLQEVVVPRANATRAWRQADVAVALRDDDATPLPGTRLEVEALARLLPGTTRLVGSSASEQELDRLAASGELGTYRLLHLATHGKIDPDRPERSALLLARDRLPDARQRAEEGKKVYTGELTVEAIRGGWRLDADLVVLSACETALGKSAGGEGVLGFAQAFLQAGARGVVLSRWKVHDTATALLMVRFYENLLGKRPGLKRPLGRAAALEEARAWLRSLPREEAERLAAAHAGGELRGSVGRPLPPLRAGPAKLPGGDRPFAQPFYWAAFVLIGEPE